MNDSTRFNANRDEWSVLFCGSSLRAQRSLRFSAFKIVGYAEGAEMRRGRRETTFPIQDTTQAKIEKAFRTTSLPDQGWELSDTTHCLYANMYRSARTLLEDQGIFGAARIN